ncbi:P-II family nitrogen regulator [Brevibacterium sp. 50QC2O2]|jgi:nitrogen regulatory protein PII|uniref:P-II family nitrogen regulator n=1 Tax=Brevibacterium TaxID=1696 RepID=UPI00211BDFA4|nr:MULTISPECIES: P-II family nitrogen regulator [unclassified Brevibacterium]MCQ9368820.1 P-II family nitrogen regulator [Brevibacterium sp. 91QC2O2]MCQ9386204.1 P-II family nitrogen regulator [Brevibacterium sp. 68QC2CO]MCQ9388534.1 P-II family nitrogen regulator [Brevibacterium sp. 50QC2O2]
MQLITAILQPSALGPVKTALDEVGITGMTVYEAKGHGTQAGKVEVYRSQKVRVEFLPKISLEIVVADESVDAAIQAIAEAAHTGQIGDGKIWATPVSRVVRVRTGETGTDAI